ncbi:MAG: LysR family transcriptional regulator [Bdellovibrionota bacterium]
MKFPAPDLLQVLIAFQESKNLVQAAQKLKISQPAVTQRLQRLQEQVAQPLYAYEGRKKVLTQYGKALYDMTLQNFNQLGTDFESLNRRYAAPEQLVLRVGGQKELVSLFSEVIRFPGQMDCRKLSETQAVTALKSESIDVALSASIFDSAEWMSRKFLECSSHLIFHRKIFPNLNGFRDFQEEPNLLIQAPCARHRIETDYMERFCRGVKINPDGLNDRALFEDWHSILGFVESRNGYAVVPGFIQSQSKDIVSFDIPHAIIPRSSYYASFQRKLKKIESFKQVLNFAMSSS